MRLLPMLVAVLAVWPASAQEGPFTVVASSPAPGDSSVALHATIRFTFSAPLDTTHRFASGLPVAFFKPPAPVDSVYYNDDLTTIYLDVSHEDDTDYVWILTGAYGPASQFICTPHVLSYTTAPGTGRGRVEGFAYFAVTTKHQGCWWDPVVALLDGPPSEEARVMAATLPFDTHDFRIDRVRPGTYWPALFYDWEDDGEITPPWGEQHFGPDYAFYDAEWDGRPDSIVVTDTSRFSLELGLGFGGAAERNAELPGTAYLLPNYPNPFNPQTTLAFELERPARLRLTVHDVLGREVAVLAEGHYATGRHEVAWTAGAAPSGVYLARLAGDAFVLTRKLLLVK